MSSGSLKMAVALLVGIAYSGLLLANSLPNPPEKPPLQNDEMCGITTGGQARNSWIDSNISKYFLSGRVLVGLHDHLRHVGGWPSYR